MNTIKLKAYLEINNEYEAAEAITPGMLIELNSDGKVQKHSSGEGTILTMLAIEDELQGKGIEDDYEGDDPVQCWVPTPGDEAYAILADGNDVSIGDFLASDGDGTLQKSTTNPVAVALEAKDTSGSSGEESSGELGYAKRIKVRIL